MKIAVFLLLMSATAGSTWVYADESSMEEQKLTKLKTVKVVADGEIADGPVGGYHAKRSATGTKTDVSLMETPISVQVISREIMDDQQVLTIKDAIKNVSGVYTSTGPDGNTMDFFNIRGFEVDSYGSSYLDGVRDFSRSPKETAGLERIEVLKGPAAIMYGRIEPGGMVNRVSKKPIADQFTKVQQQIGSHNSFRTTLDANGLMSDDESWLYRANVAIEDSDGYKDDTHNRRVYVAPQITWQASEQTRINTGIEYQKNNRSWALTYGTIGDANGPVDIPISTNLHDKNDFYKDDSLSWNLNWDHQFNDDWKIQQRITYVDRSSVAEGSLLNPLDEEGNYSRIYWGWDDEEAQIASTNLDLNGKFKTGNINHTLLIGIDFYDEDYDSGGWSYGGTPVVTNIQNPDNHSAPYDLDHLTVGFGYSNKHSGIYLQDQMNMLDDRLHIMIGTRYDQADHNGFYDTYIYGSKDKKNTWRGGILYRATENISLYTSYVEGFGMPNTSSPSDEIKFDPQTSHQYEIGTKVELSPEIGITLAAFQLIKDNLTMADPEDNTKTILAGEATSDGFEMDITGQISDNWNVIAAYAYTDVRFTRSDLLQGERMQAVPRHGASLWSSYFFGSSGWQTGGGIVYRSERLGTQRAWAPDIYPYMMNAYTLLDVMVAYEFTISNLPVKAQLNISNVTDKRYYPSTYGGAQRISQGEPRHAVASINVHF